MPIANSLPIRKKIIALVLMSLSALTANAEVQIRGAASCGQWISGQKGEPKWLALVNERWLLGHLSGFAVARNTNFLDGTDNDSIFLWVSNYCQANPLKNIADAAFALYDELVKQKRL